VGKDVKGGEFGLILGTVPPGKAERKSTKTLTGISGMRDEIRTWNLPTANCCPDPLEPDDFWTAALPLMRDENNRRTPSARFNVACCDDADVHKTDM
jgi:hypothetical protein